MARKVFFSFHFAGDYWRTQQVRNMGALDGQTFCTPSAWEEVKKKGAASIEKWIDDNMAGKSCVLVLTGGETAERPWVRKEIIKGWNAGKGVLAVRIHKLLDSSGSSGTFGTNPLSKVTHGPSKKLLSTIAPIYNPSGSASKEVYESIKDNVGDWIEEAIAIRKAND